VLEPDNKVLKLLFAAVLNSSQPMHLACLRAALQLPATAVVASESPRRVGPARGRVAARDGSGHGSGDTSAVALPLDAWERACSNGSGVRAALAAAQGARVGSLCR
jgi:hypothetical protein